MRQHTPWGTFQTQMYITISSIFQCALSSPPPLSLYLSCIVATITSNACHYVVSFFFCLDLLLAFAWVHVDAAHIHSIFISSLSLAKIIVMLPCLRFNFVQRIQSANKINFHNIFRCADGEEKQLSFSIRFIFVCSPILIHDP